MHISHHSTGDISGGSCKAQLPCPAALPSVITSRHASASRFRPAVHSTSRLKATAPPRHRLTAVSVQQDAWTAPQPFSGWRARQPSANCPAAGVRSVRHRLAGRSAGQSRQPAANRCSGCCGDARVF